jgi:hypothetical protein
MCNDRDDDDGDDSYDADPADDHNASKIVLHPIAPSWSTSALSLRCQQLEPETAVELSSLDLSIGSGR